MKTPPAAPLLPADYPRLRIVATFGELIATPFANGVNAVCWPRTLQGDFAEVTQRLRVPEGITRLTAARLRRLPLSTAGRQAVEFMLADEVRLRAVGLTSELNCIGAYPRDEDDALAPTHVYSFHADSAPVAAETVLCTYAGAPSEGLRHDEARRRSDDPTIRAELLRRFGGVDDAAFAEYLAENCQDLHYLPRPGARPFSFGTGHLWRIAVDYPGSLVPPCLHRAPEHGMGQPPRLLLIG